jgi:hypothetical protein
VVSYCFFVPTLSKKRNPGYLKLCGLWFFERAPQAPEKKGGKFFSAPQAKFWQNLIVCMANFTNFDRFRLHFHVWTPPRTMQLCRRLWKFNTCVDERLLRNLRPLEPRCFVSARPWCAGSDGKCDGAAQPKVSRSD